MRIMYVEDNAINLGLVRRIAKMGNHEVISYANGPDALKALETEDVDLILMDIELEGEMDGIEVVKRLRARGDNRPIVAVTAYAMVGDKDRILAAGCNGYLPKPLPVAQFLQILAKYDPVNMAKSTQETKAVTPPATPPAGSTKPAKASTETKATPAQPKPVAEAKPAKATAKPQAEVTAGAKSTVKSKKESLSTEAQADDKKTAESKAETVPTETKTDDQSESAPQTEGPSTKVNADDKKTAEPKTETAPTEAKATEDAASAQSEQASSATEATTDKKEESVEPNLSTENKSEQPSKETMPPEK